MNCRSKFGKCINLEYYSGGKILWTKFLFHEQQIIEPITSLDEAVQWCETVCGVVDTSQTTIADVVRQGYVVEVKETFRNFRDSGMQKY